MSTHPKLNAYLDSLQVPETYRPRQLAIDADPAKAAEMVLDYIADGNSLRKACKLPGAPSATMFLRWVNADPKLMEHYSLARKANAEHMASLVLDTALSCTSETANGDKVQIAAYQWLAGKMAPKVYGDKLEVDVNQKITLESLIIDAFKQLKSEPAPVIDAEYTPLASDAEGNCGELT